MLKIIPHAMFKIQMKISKIQIRHCFLLLLALFLMQAANIHAQSDSTSIVIPAPSSVPDQWRADKPWPISKYTVRLGAFWAVNTTKLGAGIDGKDYSLFSFEDELNMDRNTYSGMLNFDVRFGKHHRIDLSYYNILRKKSTTIDREIHFADRVYPVNSDIDFHLNTNIIRLSYGYSFLSNKKWEVGGLFGFHVMAFDTGFDWDGNNIDKSYNSDVKFTAPLPDVGVFATFAINDRWAVSGEASWLYVKYKDLTGRILNASFYGQYKLSRRWEVALGYNGYDVLVQLDRKRLDAEFQWGYSGPFANVAFKFGK